MTGTPVAASFRDPSGFLYRSDGTLYRQVQPVYRPHYERLMDSGLYDELVADGLLVAHEEAPLERALGEDAYRVLRPDEVPFVSYPFEWCFDQLRDAALATLEIQARSIERGLTLKDASAYNIQYVEGRPVLIDTLSFETYEEGRPWIAYRQFCQHFLAPLLLMATVDVRLGGLLRQHLDGVPLDLASALLPRRTWLRFGTLLHVHLHARSLRRHAGTRPEAATRGRTMSRTAMLGLVDSLRSTVTRLRWEPGGTEWAHYDTDHSYTDAGMAAKRGTVARWVAEVAPRQVWDLGANTGDFSRIAAESGAHVVAMDGDPGAVTRAYRASGSADGPDVLPLLIDLTNPTPALGWGYGASQALTERGAPDLVLALALTHHLALSGNLPLPRILDELAGLAPYAVVEFVPKTDPQARRLLLSREDVFEEYTAERFEAAAAERFDIAAREPVPDSERVLYLLRRRDD